MKLTTKLCVAAATFTMTTSAFSMVHPAYVELRGAITQAIDLLKECADFEASQMVTEKVKAVPQYATTNNAGYKFIKSITCNVSTNNAVILDDGNEITSLSATTDKGALVANILFNTQSGQFMTGMTVVLVPLSDVDGKAIIIDPTNDGNDTYILPNNAIRWGSDRYHSHCLAFAADPEENHLIPSGTAAAAIGTGAYNFSEYVGVPMCKSGN